MELSPLGACVLSCLLLHIAIKKMVNQKYLADLINLNGALAEDDMKVFFRLGSEYLFDKPQIHSLGDISD
jgi:hypothetical protein